MVSLYFVSIMYIWEAFKDSFFNHTFLCMENFIKHLTFCQENNAFYLVFCIAYLMLFAVELNSSELWSLVCSNLLVWIMSIFNKRIHNGMIFRVNKLSLWALLCRRVKYHAHQALISKSNIWPCSLHSWIFNSVTAKIFETNFLTTKPSFTAEANEIMIHCRFRQQGWAVWYISMEQTQEEFLIILRVCLLLYLSLVKCWLIVSLKQFISIIIVAHHLRFPWFVISLFLPFVWVCDEWLFEIINFIQKNVVVIQEWEWRNVSKGSQNDRVISGFWYMVSLFLEIWLSESEAQCFPENHHF